MGSMGSDNRLKALIKRLTLFENQAEGFQLASGTKSPYIFNIKNLFGNAEASNLVTEKLLQALATMRFDYIAGLELGAVFPVTAVVHRSGQVGKPIAGFVVRREKKKHGTKNQFEGQRDPPHKGVVVVIDDVTTTGGSLLEVVDTIRGLGCTVEEAVTIVDREEGAFENLRKHGVRLIPLFKKSEILDIKVH